MTAARPIALLALVLAVLLAGYLLLFRGSGGHEYTLLFDNAGQLVKDDDVQVGGRRIGSVRAIELTDDNQAAIKVEVEEPYAPLREGTQAVIRLTSLSGVANRYVALTLGADNNAPARRRRDAGRRRRRPRSSTSTSCSTRSTRRPAATCRTSSRASPRSTRGAARRSAQSAKYFNPLLSTSRVLADQLTEDEGALTRFIVNSSQAVTALAERRDDLSGAGHQRQPDRGGDRRRERRAVAARCRCCRRRCGAPTRRS